MYETLHSHTTTSDGILSYTELLDLFKHNSISTVAFTDHDALINADTFLKLKKLNHEVKFISGIEISVNTLKELEGTIPSSASFHMIGLFVDPTDTKLKAYCDTARENRMQRMSKYVEHFVQLGFNITLDEVRAQTPGDILASPHLVSALLKHPENEAIIAQVITQMPEEKARLVKSHRPDKQIYDIYLGNDPFIKGIKVPYLHMMSMDDAVSLIRNAGGIASIAHWFTVNPPVDKQMLINFAKEKRIDGLETINGFLDPVEMQERIEDDIVTLKEIVNEYDLLETGGVDFHKPADLGRLVEDRFARRAQDTIGMTTTILKKKPEINTQWSSLSSRT